MPLSSVRSDTTARLVELQQLLRIIFANEAQRPTPAENQTIKGFFVVGLYAYIEFSLGRIISTSVNHINALQVQHKHLRSSLYTMAVESKFMSASDSRGEKKWKKRYDILASQNVSDFCQIHDSVLGNEMQNTRFSTIELACELFSVSASPVINPATISYINEIGERRNAIAHGRESPSEVGRRYTAASLELRLNSVTNQFTHLIIQFEDLINNKKYIKPNCRRMYP